MSSAWKFAKRFAVVIFAAGFLSCLIGGAVGSYLIIQAYSKLPDLNEVKEYKPKIPLRIYDAEKNLIGEFGEERRDFVALKDIPTVMRQAVLAAEDDRFYEHKGIDFQGVLRAAINNARGGPKQGASTITQQVARNFFLSREQTLKRKLLEAMLAYKMESSMTKDQILELYMNQIFLGQRSYGFSAAAHIYYGKSLQELSVAESAMLAGLPKAPSSFNPVSNPQRARARQLYVLGRMKTLNYIGEDVHKKAVEEKLALASGAQKSSSAKMRSPNSDYAVEMARQWAVDKFKEEAYTKGISIETTIDPAEQDAAYKAVRKALLAYDRSKGYRGPEDFFELGAPPPKEQTAETSEEMKAQRELTVKALRKAFAGRPESDGLYPAVVMEASPASKSLRVRLSNGDDLTLGAEAVGWAAGHLSPSLKDKALRRGAVVRVAREDGKWVVSQMPEASSAFISMSTSDGAIRSMVGGFDFNANKFNRAAQALRQPGSSFKPFIYSAALEKGLAPSTMINDAPFVYDPGQGATPWVPKNYDGKADGPMSMRQALTRSKNLVSARIIDHIGPQFAQAHAMRFGFDPAKNPPVHALALGAGAVTPMQMAAAYGVFATGGYRLEPYLVRGAKGPAGEVLYQAAPKRKGDESILVLEARNAYVMESMLKDVAQKGTAAKASAELARSDLAGKTGTTNDSVDAWFAGYHPDIVAVAWMGFDQPKSLGARETGGGLSLPIWIDYMKVALKSRPQGKPAEPPEGVLTTGGELYFSDFPPGIALGSLGLSEAPRNPEEEASPGGKIELIGGAEEPAKEPGAEAPGNSNSIRLLSNGAPR